jgi:hypothetical protein
VAPRAALAIACGAAVVASAGDLLLLWVAATTRPALGLGSAPTWALGAGHLAGVLAIPLYGLGWAAVARPLAAARPRDAAIVRGAGMYGAALGAAIHGITGAVLAAERGIAGWVIEPLAVVLRWGTLLVPLWALATLLVLAASWRWTRAAWHDAAGVPRWTAWTNPALGTIALGTAGAVTPIGQALLVPAAPNLAHAVFFATIALTLRQRH